MSDNKPIEKEAIEVTNEEFEKALKKVMEQWGEELSKDIWDD